MKHTDEPGDLAFESRLPSAGPDLVRRALLRAALATIPAAALTWGTGCGNGDDDADIQPQSPPQTPQEALAALQDGNRRFSENRPSVRSTEEIERIWTTLPAQQAPFASILACADSRLAPELIFDQFFGDLFVVREAGNIAASPTNLGSLEYGQASLGSKLLLVLGHTDCGAVRSAFTGQQPGANIQAVVDAIRPGIAGATSLDDAIVRNVRAIIATVRERSPLLRAAEMGPDYLIVGGVYNIVTGEVTFLDE